MFEDASRQIKRGDASCLRAELDAGLDPNLANQYGWTLLMVAAMDGNTSVGRLLIEKGAELNSRNKFRDTALSLAIHTGHIHSFDCCSKVALLWNAIPTETR